MIKYHRGPGNPPHLGHLIEDFSQLKIESGKLKVYG
jgi:hypothetical protein